MASWRDRTATKTRRMRSAVDLNLIFNLVADENYCQRPRGRFQKESDPLESPIARRKIEPSNVVQRFNRTGLEHKRKSSVDAPAFFKLPSSESAPKKFKKEPEVSSDCYMGLSGIRIFPCPPRVSASPATTITSSETRDPTSDPNMTPVANMRPASSAVSRSGYSTPTDPRHQIQMMMGRRLNQYQYRTPGSESSMTPNTTGTVTPTGSMITPISEMVSPRFGGRAGGYHPTWNKH